ncbi:MAG: hypothetical protein COT74_13865 [Bdellovibrionales bacterium CG10_big_fil_rev_8_21_14_0_10_45_34]|nr:MAG: hypothetical protein COT74_13865 [Bdellovibrionales bacterium CG10_big_fil_rev_8_21_14_0_10_45_34]
MERNPEPSLDLAKKTLPAQLFAALEHVFSKRIYDTVLVGGTALSGFYAGHRRSDDLDLFTKSEKAQIATVKAVGSLTELGAILISERESAFFYDSTWSLRKHDFTAQVVLDERLFAVGSFSDVGSIKIADLKTIFKMKAATLVSRCSEKDLYDLMWLFERFSEFEIKDLIESGNEVDGGVNTENMFASVAGTILRLEACDFALDKSIRPQETYQRLLQFQKELKAQLFAYLKAMPTPELGKLVRQARKVLK